MILIIKVIVSESALTDLYEHPGQSHLKCFSPECLFKINKLFKMNNNEK